jgi:hypothetical protein
MRVHLASAAAAAMISTLAVAQPANRDPNTPAVNTPNAPPNPDAPAAGANSFTEGQAKSRIESNGFANVSDLRKDDQGVWRGKAMKDGKSGASCAMSRSVRGRAVALRMPPYSRLIWNCPLARLRAIIVS